jgi:hypothetical protein
MILRVSIREAFFVFVLMLMLYAPGSAAQESTVSDSLTPQTVDAARQDSPSSVAIGQSTSSDKTIELPAYVVEAESVPARLKIDFR